MSSKQQDHGLSLDDKKDLPFQPDEPYPVDHVSARRESLDDNIAGDQTREQSWLGKYVWDTVDLPPAERRFMFKLDAVMLTFASLGYFLKNLDQTNATSAFVSGMKEELSMYGDELVTSTSIWTAGYCVAQIPSNLLLTRVSPRYIIPALEFGWGIATLATYAVRSYKTLYVCRFFVGFFEAGFYPGIHYLFGSYYTKRELAKRATIFWIAGKIGDMFSGFLQAAAHKNLNGTFGLAGWRWLYIIDAIITIPIALLGFFFLPDLPDQLKPSFMFSANEIKIARDRMAAIGRKGRAPWTKARVLSFFTGWRVYVLPLLYIIWVNSVIQNPMAYWLKSFNANTPPVPGVHYSVSQINLLPLPATAITIVVALSWAWLSDGLLHGRRWPFIYLGAAMVFTIALCLHSIPLYSNRQGHFALYWLSQCGSSAGPMILGWISEISSDDNEGRAVLIAMANNLAYVVQAVAPLFVWKTSKFPAALKGMEFSMGMSALLVVWTSLTIFCVRREVKKAVERGQDEKDRAFRQRTQDVSVV